MKNSLKKLEITLYLTKNKKFQSNILYKNKKDFQNIQSVKKQIRLNNLNWTKKCFGRKMKIHQLNFLHSFDGYSYNK